MRDDEGAWAGRFAEAIRHAPLNAGLQLEAAACQPLHSIPGGDQPPKLSLQLTRRLSL